MRMLKIIERWNKTLWYETVIRLLFRNPPTRVPVPLSQARRLLLIRRDMMGDMIITTSLIRSLNHLNPKMEVDVYAAPRGKVVIEHNPRVKTIFSAKPFGRFFWRELAQARKRDYDIILCLSYTGTTADGLLANLISRRAIKLGMREPGRDELYRHWFNAQVDVGKTELGATEPLWKSLHRFLEGAFGERVADALIRQEIFVSESEKRQAERFISEKQLARFVVFNLSARMEYRKWGMRNNEAFLREASARHSTLQFVIVFGPDDRTEATQLARRVAAPNVYLAPNFEFRSLCHFISKASLIVSPDTAIVHVGATYQVPSVILCTSLSSGVEWTPLCPRFINVYAEKNEPISSIAPARVVEAFETMLCEQPLNTTLLSQ